MTSVLEIYGALCFLSLIAFLVLATAAKLRPDLDEEAVDIGAVEKLKTLANSEQFVNALPVGDRSAPLRQVKQSKRLIQRRPHRIHTRKPRRPNQAA
jgi:hypothetical protein